MKRIQKTLCLLLSALLLLSLASCSAKGDAEDMGAAPGENAYPNYESAPEIAPGDKSMVENPFTSVEQNNVSTLSADVDTASYAYFRKLVNAGYDLTALKNSSSAFRTEEFINYFDYEISQPGENELFGVLAQVTDCPWNVENKLLRLTLQAETPTVRAKNNLVFLIDVSGSMSSQDKLPLLKKAFVTLTKQLSPEDTVSIVTYSGKEEVVLSGARGNETQRILDAINSLRANGSTNGEAGLSMAYQVAEQHLLPDGNNRIIMASDGDLNVGISSEEQLKSFIEGKRDQGVYLSVLGFGSGNYRDSKMETIADNGNGVYYYIDGESEAEKVFGTDLLGTLYTVAKDVKLQLTFDKDYVAEYRLIGYENRLLNKEDFENDQKDAGDVGAGHQVTVCYELKLKEGALTSEAPWFKLAVRYKKPAETLSLLNEYDVGRANLKESTDADIVFLTCVIETAMLLRNSQYLGDVTLSSILEKLESLDLDAYPERVEFRSLLRTLNK